MGILLVDAKTGKISTLPVNAAQNLFFTTLTYNNDSVLVATARGIELLNTRTQQFKLLTTYKTNPVSINRLHPVQLLKVDDNTCIVSEGKELFEFDIRTRSYTARLVNLQNEAFPGVGYITGLYSDSHKNLWLLSENNGIYKINYHFAGFKYLGTPDKKNNFVKTIFADKEDNRILCGTFGSGLHIFDTTQQLLNSISSFPGIQGNATVCAFMKTAPHQFLVMLMGTWQMFELNTLTYSMKKVFVAGTGFDMHKEVPDYHLSLFNSDGPNVLLQSGYNFFKATRSSPGYLTISRLDTFDLPTLCSYMDHQKRLWIGATGKYFLSETGNSPFKSFTLPGKMLVRCFYDNSDDEIWMGTEKGLYLLAKNGNIIRSIRLVNGLTDENIYAIRKDKQANLWFTHNKGITCMKPDGSFLHFNKADGLQENEFNTNTSDESPDGELFFGGVNGITGFYPSLVTSASENPDVLLTKISVKEKEWKEDTAYWSLQKIVLPYYNNIVSFNLTAIGNRTADQYTYQYQLVNQDAEWINAGNNPQVRYVLQPGRYVFRYAAGNSFDPDTLRTKEIILIIKPPFWKTGWFIGSLILFLAIITILITRYISQAKLKRKVNELERKRMMDEERLRISREMHDDIGAGLTQITLMSEAAKSNMTGKSSLDNIAATSRQLVNSMSEIIWSLNSENNRLEQLFSYLREQLNKLLEFSGIHYKIRFPENDNGIQLNNAQRRNLLLITKEIVHNAIKHSKAKNITVDCELEGKQIIFTVSDDGAGFDITQKNTGNGLRNIQRRIEELNGSININSSPSGSVFQYWV